MNSQTFGEKIKTLRLNLNYSLKFVGDEIGCAPKLLSLIEKNKKVAPEKIIKDLSRVYKVPYKELINQYLSEIVYHQVRSCEYAEEILHTVHKKLRQNQKGTQRIESKDKILEAIRVYFSDKPIEKAWIFGSFARNATLSKDSDIDILVTFKQPNKISLFDLIQMKEELAEKTGRAVDLVEAGRELKSFQNTIHKEKFLVYGS